MHSIKIFIADDHPLFLKGLKDTLMDEKEFDILGSAINGKEALEQIVLLQPDVAILDLDMPLMNGIGVAKVLLKDHKAIKTVILSMHKETDIIKACMTLGIHGYVFKDDAVNDLVQAVRVVYNGGKYISPNNDFVMVDKTNPLIESLTKMEIIILKAIAAQKTTKQIADEQFISTKTVENHRNNISRKLNLKGNNSLLKFAISYMS